MSELNQPESSATDDLSIDKLEKVVERNKDLYDELNKLTEVEAVEAFDTGEEAAAAVQEEKKAVSAVFLKIKNIYLDNDLFRYAVWSILLMLLSTTVLTIVEYDTFRDSVSGHLGKDNPSFFDTFYNTFWWSVVTFTTVGYGDVSPVTHFGKLLSIIIMLLNFGIVTLLGGAVASVLVAERLKGDDKLDESKFNGHLIIAGWNPFVPAVLRILQTDKNSTSVVILVNETDGELIERAISVFEDLDITHLCENFTNETVLRKAFLDKAGMFMILPDNSGLLPHEEPDEDKTVLTCLTAKAISEDCPVVAHVLNPENVSHLQRANVNEIVMPDEHVPHLLAKHVTNPGVPQLFDELINQEEDDKGIQQVGIPRPLMGQTHNKISAYFKFKHQWLLVGYAIRKSGFSLEDQMGESGSPLIRDMITEQLEGAGIKLSSDEHVVVEINPPDDYVIDDKHRALVLR
ncbi:MAG: potassium channel family protein [Candidatus Neomarinimicrobiota bacterium]|nr:potassium channel family protein [Candidatus Neomarinimicrobiota bacterium]MEE3204101.1 potassium channel family protein [Candidatus Neomarinimicrobiota bacterium]